MLDSLLFMNILGFKWDKFTIRVEEVGFVDEMPRIDKDEGETPLGYFDLYLDYEIYPYHKKDNPNLDEPDYFAHLSVPLRTVYKSNYFLPLFLKKAKVEEKADIRNINRVFSELDLPLDMVIRGLEHWTGESEINEDLVKRIDSALPGDLYDMIADYGKKYKKDREKSKKDLEDYPYNKAKQKKTV